MKKKSYLNGYWVSFIITAWTISNGMGIGEVNAQDTSSPPADTPRLRLEVRKKKILTGEPIFCFFSLIGPKDKMPDNPQFQFLVNGMTVAVDPRMAATDEKQDFSWQSVGQGDRIEFNAHVMAFIDESSDPPHIITAKQGKYLVQILEKKTGLKSQAIEIEVVEPPQQAKEAFVAFTSEEAIRSFREGDVELLEKLVQKYPNTIFTSLASAYIGLAKWRAIENELAQAKLKALRENAPEETLERHFAARTQKLAELAKFFARARRLEAPCPLDELVMFHYAQCEYEAGNKAEALKIMKQLIETYGTTNGLLVEETREAAAELEQELNPQK